MQICELPHMPLKDVVSEIMSREILLIFQLQIKGASFDLRLGPGFTSAPSLRDTNRL